MGKEEISMGKEIRKLSNFEYGALKEIGNIGMGSSATSLSKLTHTGVHANILGAGFELIENIPKITGTSDSLVMGTFMHVKKELNGYILIFFPEDSARNLCQAITGESEANLADRINRSVIEEVSHILAGTYITSLADFLHIDVSISTPYNAYDMLGSILNYVLTEMCYKADLALILDSEFLVKENKIKGIFVTLFDPVSLDYLLEKINGMLNNP
ncbi:MAG: chemotaxis protein CheC [Methanosarcinaceae archaeon]|uniref:chemotaxis protein CheC n=1 Tax=Methanosarcina sp. MTP4 TaxID=1434100 RepID=UPI001E370BAD|nr:chemotaxis protein CheC [Methanosarcina sp. MTP4]